jgi:Sporulation and spore germination
VKRLAPLVAVLGLLAGCASLPNRSPARAVDTIDPSRQRALVGAQQDIRPVPGQSPYQLVSQFLASMAGWQDGHGPSRDFLSEGANSSWRDEDQIIVANRPPVVGDIDKKNNTVPVTFTPIGVVGKDGSYQPALAARQTTWTLRLIRNPEGEWRIDTPPPGGGVVLSEESFGLYYPPHTVYFLDPGGGRLVPDVRYLPDDPGTLARRLVSMLLAGPSEWLDPVVINDLQAVKLNTLQIDDSRNLIGVDLGGLNAQVNDVREGAVAQLVYTLGALPAQSASGSSLYGVQVFSDGQHVDLREGGHAVLTADDLPFFNPAALPDSSSAAGGGSIDSSRLQAYFVRDGGVYGIDGKVVEDGRHQLSAVGVSTDLDKIAGVGPQPTGGGQTLWLGTLGAGSLRQSQLGPATQTLTRPTWDRATASFWTVANGRFIERVSMDGRVHQVKLAAAQLTDPRVRIGALRLARDSTRVAYTVGLPGHQQAYVARVRSDGEVITIEQPLPIAPGVPNVLDVAWEQPTQLVILGTARGAQDVWRGVNADGSSTKPDDIPLDQLQATTLTAAPSKQPMVSTATGLILANNGTWGSPAGKEAVRGGAPVYPG